MVSAIFRESLSGSITWPGLGIQAVWIAPFYPSPMADFGYDISDYCNVDRHLWHPG